MRVEQFTNNNNKPVKNQFIIYDEKSIIFQSYFSIIAIKRNGKIALDADKWNYSKITSKYRNQFLNETTKETKEKIKSGVYTLENLN